ncbi:hypothetical protein GCM10028805_59910 [Spirosoma harenae]
MKGWLWGLFVWIVVAGCSKEEEALPTDPLYRKWLMTKVQYQTGDPSIVSPTSLWAIVEYKFNGMILYGTDGKYDPCCSPYRFKRKGNILDLVNVESIPMPERTPNGICAQVSCVAIDNQWEIVALDSTQLVIRTSRSTVYYKPYP